MADRIRVIKWESIATGGSQDEEFPSSINHNEDGIDARSLFLQDDHSNDADVEVTRDSSGNMMFRDKVTSTAKSLTDLVAGTGGLTADTHKTLRQLIHFVDDGPAEGFTSGAYKEVTGTVFPTAIVWYESDSKAKKIVERLITWTGSLATTDKWKIYDTDGSTVLWIITDAITYSGVFETHRTRTIENG